MRILTSAGIALLLSGLWSCSPGGAGAGGDSAGAHGAEIPLPCFADDGPILCRVDGIPVPEATWERYRAFYRGRNPEWSDRQVDLETLRLLIIPRAVRYALAGERVREISRKAWDAYDRIVAGDDFRTVCRDFATTAEERENAGRTGTYERGKEDGTLGAEFILRMWRQPVMVPSRPFIEYYGAVILQVTEEKKGDKTERVVRALVIPFFDETNKPSRDLNEASIKARVTDIRDPAFRKVVPVIHLRKG